jgi:type II secretory pathway pseudopilin PulG
LEKVCEVGFCWLSVGQTLEDAGNIHNAWRELAVKSLYILSGFHWNFLIAGQMRRATDISTGRLGVSLLETVLAVAILAAALAALGHQTFVGLRASVRAELQTRAALLCQSRIESLLPSANLPLRVENEPIPDALDWRWSAEVFPASEVDGMQWLVVSVHQPGPQVELSRHSLAHLIPWNKEPGRL